MLTSCPALPPLCRRILAIAERAPRRAVGLAQRGMAPASAWADLVLGWSLLSCERLTEARSPLERAAARFAGQNDQMGALCAAYGLLLLDQRRLARPGLDQEFADLAARFAQAGDPHTAALIQLDQARALNAFGRPREAQSLLEAIGPQLSAQGPLPHARMLRVLAMAASSRGDYPQATALLAAAEQVFREQFYPIDRAICWLEQATVAALREDLSAALALFARAAAVFTRFDLPLQRAYCLKSSGFCWMRLGTYDKALAQTLEALALFHSLDRKRDSTLCILHLGNIYYYTQRLEAALAAYIRAEDYFVSAGVALYQIIARRNQAMVYRALGRHEAAWALLTRVEREAEQFGLASESAEVWSAQAGLLADQGQRAMAATHYDQAAAAFVRLGNLAGAAECRLEQGWLAIQAGDQARAGQLLRAAAPDLQRHPHHLWRIHYGLARCASAGDADGTALDHYLAASATIAALRQRLASEEVSSRLYSQAAAFHAEALALAAAQSDPTALLALAEGQRALILQRLLVAPQARLSADAQAAHEALRQQISRLLDAPALDSSALDAALAAYGELITHSRLNPSDEPDLDQLLPARPLDLDRVRAALNRVYGADWTSIVYVVAAGTLHIVCVTPDGLELAATPNDADLKQLLTQASLPSRRGYIYNDLPYLQRQTAQPWDLLRQLAVRLIPPAVLRRLHPQHRLLIVPAGPLHALPWPALRLEARWLVEGAVLQLLPALALAPLLAARHPVGQSALVAGCSSFGDRAPALPGVGAELAAVAARWPGPHTQLFDATATHAGLRAAISGLRGDLGLLHLASHARQLAAHGLAAHVKLWDGDLLLPEVVGLGLAGTLVVLSACEGAAADVLPGEEVLSLSWAWLAGGASGVVTSLWPTGDTALRQMMEALYTALAQGDDPALALALVQRRLIGGDLGQALRTPLAWASLLAVGGITRSGAYDQGGDATFGC